MNRRKILWIVRTAAFIALLTVFQASTSSLGNTILTGSGVNMLLILSVIICGIMSGISVAVISPIIAKFIGIGPFWSLIPFIIAGNIILVLIWHLIYNKNRSHNNIAKIVALILAAVAKFLVLYTGIVIIAVPLLGLKGLQAAVISNMFSLPQLITALLGGASALIIITPLKRAHIT